MINDLKVVESLSYAIVVQAVKDYEKAKMEDDMLELEMLTNFFCSQWFEFICPNYDGKWIVNKLGKVVTNTSSSSKKICAQCKKTLPATTEYFPASDIMACGLGSICKDCSSTVSRILRLKSRENNKRYRNEKTDD